MISLVRLKAEHHLNEPVVWWQPLKLLEGILHGEINSDRSGWRDKNKSFPIGVKVKASWSTQYCEKPNVWDAAGGVGIAKDTRLSVNNVCCASQWLRTHHSRQTWVRGRSFRVGEAGICQVWCGGGPPRCCSPCPQPATLQWDSSPVRRSAVVSTC